MCLSRCFQGYKKQYYPLIYVLYLLTQPYLQYITQNANSLIMVLNSTINSHRIQMSMLTILHISAWACLVRSDFNFVLVFFCYFIFVSSREYFVTNVVFFIMIGLIILDIFFFIFVPSTWMASQKNNTVWNSLKSIHGFAIFCSAIIFITKLPLIYFLWAYRQEVKSKQSN